MWSFISPTKKRQKVRAEEDKAPEVEETAAGKRLRLAKEYLARLEESGLTLNAQDNLSILPSPTHSPNNQTQRTMMMVPIATRLKRGLKKTW